MKLDKYEKEVLAAFEAGTLKPVASKDELARIRAAARATAIKDQRINIRLSAGDLRDIQVKALQEGMPYQTLIASVLHKYATGRLAETGTNPPPTAEPVFLKPAAIPLLELWIPRCTRSSLWPAR